jgi:hypothetical protein
MVLLSFGCRRQVAAARKRPQLGEGLRMKPVTPETPVALQRLVMMGKREVAAPQWRRRRLEG